MILVEYFEYLVECILKIISINMPNFLHYHTSSEKKKQMKTYKPYNISINTYVSPPMQKNSLNIFPKYLEDSKTII